MNDIRTSMGLDADETAFDGELQTFVLGAINSLTDQGSVVILALGVSLTDITWTGLLSAPKYQDNGLEGLVKETSPCILGSYLIHHLHVLKGIWNRD